MTDRARSAGIVVVGYGSHALLERNLVPLARAVPATVFVVDSYSSDDERAAMRALAERESWTLIAPSRNVGFGAGVNAGAASAFSAGCERVLALNPDVVLTPDALDALLAAADAHPRTLLSPRVAWPDGTTWFAGGQIDLARGLTRTRPDHAQVGRGRWLTGACLLVDRGLWEELGGFDERFFLYWEDIELSQRCLERGADLRVVHEVTAVHDVGATHGTDGKSALYCRENCKNRLLFATIHLPPRQRLRWLVSAPRYALRVLTREGRRAAIRRVDRAAAAALGTLAGAAIVVRSIVADRAAR
jgi:GT2 family glycosyltransferase